MKVKHLFRIAFSIAWLYLNYYTIDANMFDDHLTLKHSIGWAVIIIDVIIAFILVAFVLENYQFMQWYRKIMDEEV